MTSPVLQARGDGATCAVCRKQFKPGDRVSTAFIVQSVGRNPSNKEFGAFLSEEFEMVHITCADPQLMGIGIIGVPR
jgi:hypothetical protein